MQREICQRLDDYLDGDLADSELAAFTRHLPACTACHRAVAGHERLAGLLAAATASPVPPGMAGRVRCRGQAMHRRRLAAACGLLASAAVIIWLVSRTDSPLIEHAEPPEVAEVPRTAQVVSVNFPRGTVIAVPEVTGLSNVTFYWVYPTTQSTVPERTNQ
jgi:anti-sigma factor RsiW